MAILNARGSPPSRGQGRAWGGADEADASGEADDEVGGVGEGDPLGEGGPADQRRPLEAEGEQHPAEERTLRVPHTRALAQFRAGPGGRRQAGHPLAGRLGALGVPVDHGHHPQGGVDPGDQGRLPGGGVQADGAHPQRRSQGSLAARSPLVLIPWMHTCRHAGV